MRFGFDADLRAAYRVGLPILIVWFSGTVVAVLASTDTLLPGLISITTTLLVPWMHHALKAYQHSHAMYGDSRFVFDPVLRKFYVVYLKGIGVLFLGGIVAVAILQLARDEIGAPGTQWTTWNWIIVASSGLAVFVITWPFFAARVQQLVWAHTRLGDDRQGDAGAGEVWFRTEIAAGPLFGLVFWNVGLTLLTAGLYGPYATVALARYRVQCMRVESTQPLAMIATGARVRESGAVGDSAVDAFGLDIGL